MQARLARHYNNQIQSKDRRQGLGPLEAQVACPLTSQCTARCCTAPHVSHRLICTQPCEMIMLLIHQPPRCIYNNGLTFDSRAACDIAHCRFRLMVCSATGLHAFQAYVKLQSLLSCPVGLKVASNPKQLTSILATQDMCVTSNEQKLRLSPNRLSSRQNTARK